MSSTPPRGSPACADALLESLLHSPWSRLGRGPSSFDCWGFVRHVLVHGMGWDGCPEFPYSDEQARDHEALFDRLIPQQLATGAWVPLARPEPYCVVMLGQTARVSHVGLWHPSNTVFHCAETSGVVGQRVPALRALGWTTIQPFRHSEMRWLSPT